MEKFGHNKREFHNIYVQNIFFVYGYIIFLKYCYTLILNTIIPNIIIPVPIKLQEWVTATDLRLSLDRFNTFGDEIFYDTQVLQSYWYAIADVAVGARCKCNGHASKCDTKCRFVIIFD